MINILKSKTQSMRNILLCAYYIRNTIKEQALPAHWIMTYLEALKYSMVLAYGEMKTYQIKNNEDTSFFLQVRDFLSHEENLMLNEHDYIDTYRTRIRGAKRLLTDTVVKAKGNNWQHGVLLLGALLEKPDNNFIKNLYLLRQSVSSLAFFSSVRKMYLSEAEKNLQKQAKSLRNETVHWGNSFKESFDLPSLYYIAQALANRLTTDGKIADLTLDNNLEKKISKVIKNSMVEMAIREYLALLNNNASIAIMDYKTAQKIRSVFVSSKRGKGFSAGANTPMLKTIDAIIKDKSDALQQMKEAYFAMPGAQELTKAFRARYEKEAEILDAVIPDSVRRHPDYTAVIEQLTLPPEERL